MFLWCFVIYCCGPDECQSFSTYVPPLTTLHSSSSTDLHQLRRHVSSGTVMISLFLMFFTSPLPFYQPPYYSPRHEEMEREESEGLRETREGWCRTPMGFLVCHITVISITVIPLQAFALLIVHLGSHQRPKRSEKQFSI